jgi:hypothetical protein
MYLASSSTTARLAADSSPVRAAVGAGTGTGVARQAETRTRRDDGSIAAAAGLTGAMARKDWSEFMEDSRWMGCHYGEIYLNF